MKHTNNIVKVILNAKMYRLCKTTIYIDCNDNYELINTKADDFYKTEVLHELLSDLDDGTTVIYYENSTDFHIDNLLNDFPNLYFQKTNDKQTIREIKDKVHEIFNYKYKEYKRLWTVLCEDIFNEIFLEKWQTRYGLNFPDGFNVEFGFTPIHQPDKNHSEEMNVDEHFKNISAQVDMFYLPDDPNVLIKSTKQKPDHTVTVLEFNKNIEEEK